VVSHELATLSRVQGRMDFWLSWDFSPEVDVAIATDCNHVSD
jgi:hypothetical protein